MHRTLLALAALLLAVKGVAAVTYPAKTARTLHSPAQVALARQLAARPDGARVLQAVRAAADKWADWSDQDLAALVTPPSVPRAFNISFQGCPVHGREAFATGNYSFKIDLRRPFKVVCPVGGEEYPSNDFAAYLATGLKDKSLLIGPYADDGWGWRKEGEDKKYWFVAYYNHWAYLNHIIPGALNLSRAYLLTGEPRYAHQAIILLDRIADVYPGMDHNKQSRYATEFVSSYAGKIVNLIWETGVGTNLCEAYDNVWDAVDADTAAQRLLGKTGPQIRANIEQHLVAEVIEGVYNGRIRGNFGMHQETLLTAGLVAQDGREQEIARYLLDNEGGNLAIEGYRYALANYFTREGISNRETAPGYCGIWRDKLAAVAGPLAQFGFDLSAGDRLRDILAVPERMIMLGSITPSIGDSGAVQNGAVHTPAPLARLGWREYGDPVFARSLQAQGAAQAAYTTYQDLFEPPTPPLPAAGVSDGSPAPPLPKGEGKGEGLLVSRLATDLMDGYGLAMLRSPKRPVEWTLFYGPSPQHGHYDKLNIDCYAFGQKLLPDLGYPQFAADDPEPPGWTRHNVSHNTVMINARRQESVAAGRVRAFAATPTVQAVEIDAPVAYQSAAKVYRRLLVAVDSGDCSYALDVFRVIGGRQHDYILHGPAGELAVSGLDFPEPAPGTLAGPTVPYAFFYDDDRFAKQGQKSGYHSYQGSGFAFLLAPQRAEADSPWSADWRLASPAGSHLRLTWLPQGKQEQILCDGKPPFNPSNPPVLKYALSRRVGSRRPLASTFVSLVEPYQGQPGVLQAASLTQGAGEAPVAVEVKTAGGCDLIVARGEGKAWQGKDMGCTAHLGILSLDNEGRFVRAVLVGAGEIHRGGWRVEAPAEALQGTVAEVSGDRRQVVVTPAAGSKVDPAALAGSTVRFVNARRTACFKIAAARLVRGRLTLTLAEPPELGLIKVRAAKGTEILAKTYLPQRDVRRYDGATVTDAKGRPLCRIVSVTADDDDVNHLQVEPLHPGGPLQLPTPGQDARLLELGPGDQAEVQAVVHVELTKDGTYRTDANTPATLSGPGL